MPGQVIVTADHEMSYPDPIAFEAGEAIVLTDRNELWDGHLFHWARAADGREGWVPDGITRAVGERQIAREDYSARELTCRAGENLTGLKTTHGWAWCRNESGETGWVPLRNLRGL